MTPRDFISDLMPWSGTLLLVYAVIFERESLRRLVTPHTAGGYASVDFYLCWLVSGVAAYLGKYFSKVLSLVTLLRKCTWAMTFENSLYTEWYLRRQQWRMFSQAVAIGATCVANVLLMCC